MQSTTRVPGSLKVYAHYWLAFKPPERARADGWTVTRSPLSHFFKKRVLLREESVAGLYILDSGQLVQFRRDPRLGEVILRS